jgi:hypothetical protein
MGLKPLIRTVVTILAKQAEEQVTIIQGRT